MNFIEGLSNYVLGNKESDLIPAIAMKALEEGYDTPSLRILAGLGNDYSQIDIYLKLALKEMELKLPDVFEAGLTLIKYYLGQIVDKKIDPVKGIGEIIHQVLRKTSCFDGKDQQYVYDYIGFEKLYGLYYDYDDMINPLVMVSDKVRNERINEIKEEIIADSAGFLKEYEKLKETLVNDNLYMRLSNDG